MEFNIKDGAGSLIKLAQAGTASAEGAA